MAATSEGGHNGVSHNHNDLDTFTVQIDDQELLVDPGAEPPGAPQTIRASPTGLIFRFE